MKLNIFACFKKSFTENDELGEPSAGPVTARGRIVPASCLPSSEDRTSSTIQTRRGSEGTGQGLQVILS